MTNRVTVSATEGTAVRTPPIASGAIRAASSGLPALVGVVATLVCAHVIVFSQTLAYYGDEGFDLLSAQLIAAGKKPYLDFFYQHPAFFPYATATWMRLFGDGWRGLHLISALFTCGTVVVSALYVHSRWHSSSSRWRAAAVIVLLLLIDGQRQIVQFGTVSQAYGACLFFCVCAFSLATTAHRRKTAGWVFGSGLFAGAAAASSLLTLPVVPIILLWLLWHSERSARLRWLVSYFAGFAIPFLPMLWLFARAPRQVVFDTVAYHLFYRHQVWSYHLDL
ncbi:MAG TPA: glycosyltransferase family 39 protein, partial [Vicinamibacterales bacterium]